MRDDESILDGDRSGRDHPYCDAYSEEVYFDLIAKEREAILDEFGRPTQWLDRIAKRLSDKGWLVGANTIAPGAQLGKKDTDCCNKNSSAKGKDQNQGLSEGKSKGDSAVKELGSILLAACG